jgi:peroxiredoxin
MKLINIVYATIFILILFSSCNEHGKISIEGNYPGETGEYLYISRIDVDIPIFVDSVKITKSGKFKSKFSYPGPAFYSVASSNTNFITVIAYPGDNIHLDFSGTLLQDGYSVEGSGESEDLRLLDLKLALTLASLDSLITIYESIPEGSSNDEERTAIDTQYSEIIKEQRMHNIGFIIENLNSFASIKALFQRLNENAYVLYKPTDAQYLKLVSDTLNAYYPESKQAISLAQTLENELAALNLSKLTNLASELESSDMDLDLANVSGKKIKLSSFEGKSYVLLTFWSATSKDCMNNNLQLKEFYRAYHNKGFEIYQVNLDEDESLWKQTVAYDELPWISVREDDPANATSLIQYNVNKVPTNYMFDKNGEIVGKDLYGRSLQIKLSQLFD